MDGSAESQKPTLDPTQWLDEHGDYLFRYALARLRNMEASEEVVQETFVSALRKKDQYSGRGSERAWLLGILKRKIIDLIRQRNRTTSRDDQGEGDWTEALFDQRGHWKSDPRIAAAAPERPLERQEFWDMIRQCLSGLPERQADAFVLREMEDKSSDEICKDLEVSSSNLWVLLYRARLGLARCLRASWLAEGGVES